jgi:hypothetical protein
MFFGRAAVHEIETEPRHAAAGPAAQIVNSRKSLAEPL